MTEEQVPIALEWDDPGLLPGVQYDVHEENGTGGWTEVANETMSGVGIAVEPEEPLRFRVQRYEEGQHTHTSLSERFTILTAQENDGRVEPVKPSLWTRPKVKRTLGGRVLRTGARTHLTFSVRGEEVSLVGTQGPMYGKAAISIDGTRVATIDLYAPQTKKRRIVFSHPLNGSGKHEVRVHILRRRSGESTGYRVDVDAFLVQKVVHPV